MKVIYIRDIPEDVYRKLKLLRGRRGISLRELIIQIMEKAVNNG